MVKSEKNILTGLLFKVGVDVKGEDLIFPCGDRNGGDWSAKADLGISQRRTELCVRSSRLVLPALVLIAVGIIWVAGLTT
jgi:hypothetical protein